MLKKFAGKLKMLHLPKEYIRICLENRLTNEIYDEKQAWIKHLN